MSTNRISNLYPSKFIININLFEVLDLIFHPAEEKEIQVEACNVFCVTISLWLFVVEILTNIPHNLNTLVLKPPEIFILR